MISKVLTNGWTSMSFVYHISLLISNVRLQKVLSEGAYSDNVFFCFFYLFIFYFFLFIFLYFILVDEARVDPNTTKTRTIN